MKASLGCALALAGACLAVRAEAQSVVVVGPQANSMALVPGALVTVPIVADLTSSGGRSLGSVTARLSWRPGVLALRGVGAGALGPPTVNADSAAGTLRFALANPGGALGQPILLNATFAVIGAPGATDTLRVTLEELANAGTFADLLPIGQTMPATVCVSTGLFGDLDESGTVNSFDALLIVTNAVGLPIAPRTTANGDVDGDGQVNTRDALIVLSYAIALPVGGFRVARLNPGACTIRTAASVQLAPRTVSVTSGDRLPLTAVVRDSAGATIQGTDLLWTSNDTTIVKTDAAGNVVAVGPGSALVFARAAPALKDSVLVVVSPTRHVWYVDQARAAQNGGVELGSSTYPFSSIGQALARAAANDSVMIAPATYGEGVRLTVPLTLVGDSTAAGATTIRNVTGAGIVVDSVGSGLVRLDRLRIEDSQGGVIVRGAGTAVVDLKDVTVARSRGVGISVRRVERLLLDGVTVRGAVHHGIEVDSVPKVQSHAVLVDVISEQTGVPRAVRIAWADSVAFDSLFVVTAGVRLDSVVAASFDGFVGRDTRGPAIEAYVRSAFALDHGDISGAADVDSSRGESPYAAALMLALGDPAGTARFANTTIHDNGRPALGTGGGDSVLVSRLSVSNSPWRQTPVPWTVAFEGQRRVAVEYSTFTDNGGAHVGFEHYEGLMVATVDSCTFQGTALRGQHLVAMDVRRSRFRNTTESAVQANNVQTVSLARLDVGHLNVPQDDWQYGGAFAVDVSEADSLSLDSLTVHDNPFGALICRSCRAVQAERSQFVNNGQYVWTGYRSSSTYVTTVALESPVRAVLRNLTVDGGGDIGVWLRTGRDGSGTFLDSSVVGGQTTLVQGDGTYSVVSGDSLVVTNAMLRGRGLGGNGVNASGLGAFTLRGTLIDSTYLGVDVTGPGLATAQGNMIRGVSTMVFESNYSPVVFDSNTVSGCASGGTVVYLYMATGTLTRNHITGCTYALNSYTGYVNGMRVALLGNTIVRDTLDPDWGAAVVAEGSYDSVIVAGNTILGGRGQGVSLHGSSYGIAGARVDSNTVQGILSDGVLLGGSFTGGPVAMRYNALADNGTGLSTSVPVQGQFNTVARNKGHGASFSSVTQSQFRFGNYVGNGHYAVSNSGGSPPPVVADSSYWGRATGPRCFAGCDTSSVTVGDSVSQYVTFLPYDTALVATAPPVPLLLPTAVFRAARPVASVPPHASIRRPPPVSPPQPGRVQP